MSFELSDNIKPQVLEVVESMSRRDSKPRGRPNLQNIHFKIIKGSLSSCSDDNGSQSQSGGYPSDDEERELTLGPSYIAKGYQTPIIQQANSIPDITITPYQADKEEAEESENLKSRLLHFSPFAERPDLYYKIKSSMVIKTWHAGEIIREENELYPGVDWILLGSCTVSKSLDLIRNTRTGDLLQFIPGDVLKSSQEIKAEMVDTQDLESGDNTLCGTCWSQLYLSTSIMKSRFTIRANVEGTVTATITPAALIEMSHPNSTALLIMGSSVYGFTDEFLYREYIEQHSYDQLRIKVQQKRAENQDPFKDSLEDMFVKKLV